MLPMALAKHIMPPGVLDMKDFSTASPHLLLSYHHLTFFKKISEDIEQILYDLDDAKRGGKRSIFYELRDSPTLPSTEKSSLRLEHEGTLLVMAGTERSVTPRFS